MIAKLFLEDRGKENIPVSKGVRGYPRGYHFFRVQRRMKHANNLVEITQRPTTRTGT